MPLHEWIPLQSLLSHIRQCRPGKGKPHLEWEGCWRWWCGAIWLCRCHRELVITVDYIWCNHFGRISDGMGAGINILQVSSLSSYSCLSWWVEISSKSGKPQHFQQKPPLDRTFLCELILLFPSPWLPHLLTSSFLSSSPDRTNYYKDTNNLEMMKWLQTWIDRGLGTNASFISNLLCDPRQIMFLSQSLNILICKMNWHKIHLVSLSSLCVKIKPKS